MRRRILPVILVALAGAIAGCASNVTRAVDQQIIARQSVLPLIPEVCGKGNPFGNAVVLIALTKDGNGRAYLCNKDYGPSEPGKPRVEATLPPGLDPVAGTAGSVDYIKFATPGVPDPCKWMSSGGRKTYICW